HFVGFLHRVRGDAGEVLLQVPRAAIAWVTQARHDLQQRLDIVQLGHVTSPSSAVRRLMPALEIPAIRSGKAYSPATQSCHGNVASPSATKSPLSRRGRWLYWNGCPLSAASSTPPAASSTH